MSIQNQTYSLYAENEKLETRARIFDRQSKLFLNQFIRPGQKILEIGCGMGGATRIIARLLDNTGFIYAIDMNQAYVSYLEKKLINDGFQNFSIQQKIVESMQEAYQYYDVIYGRAILHHVPSAKKVIHDLLVSLKPGGLMAFEEPIMNTALAVPEVKEYSRLFDWYLKLGQNKNCDYLIGQKLGPYYHELGIKILGSNLLQQIIRNQVEKETTLELMNTLQEQIISNNIATEVEVQQVKRGIEKMIQSDHIFYGPEFCQILGQKHE